jgi:hypothetical protein
MAKDKEPSQSLTEIAAQSLEEFKDQTQSAIEQYFSLLQSTMSALPWSNTNLNRILLSHATQNVTAIPLRSCKNLAKPRIFKTSFKFRPSL